MQFSELHREKNLLFIKLHEDPSLNILHLRSLNIPLLTEVKKKRFIGVREILQMLEQSNGTFSLPFVFSSYPNRV